MTERKGLNGRDLICEIPFMMFLTKVKKPGMILIMSVIMGILMFVTGMTCMPIPFSILTGIIAELVYSSGLDLRHMYMVADILNRLKNEGRTIITVTHDSEFILNCCDQVLRIGGAPFCEAES